MGTAWDIRARVGAVCSSLCGLSRCANVDKIVREWEYEDHLQKHLASSQIYA
jgi:hypothetical protein